MKFTKMHGLGNDYIYVNCFTEQVADPPALARAISDRHRGVGSDGLIMICPSESADVRMEMYNADGSRGMMCGNGIRCVAKYCYEHGLSRNNPLRVETDSGLKMLELTVEAGQVTQVRVDMGEPVLRAQRIPVRLPGERIINQVVEFGKKRLAITCVSMGNPHVIIFTEQLAEVPLAELGPQIEQAPLFPERINVHFVAVQSPLEATMRTWERGSGITQACGTGACAVLVAGVVNKKLSRTATIHLPGGDLHIEWAADQHIYMTGPAVEIFTGEWI
ncbi:MAG: Diaminopimelate epimerase [Phycisphaerae bacterium]|nr:Diaminopimelate epimerase [Phycisphaerae bacterium]